MYTVCIHTTQISFLLHKKREEKHGAVAFRDAKTVDKHKVKTERQLIAKATSSIYGLKDSIRSSYIAH